MQRLVNVSDEVYEHSQKEVQRQNAPNSRHHVTLPPLVTPRQSRRPLTLPSQIILVLSLVLLLY